MTFDKFIRISTGVISLMVHANITYADRPSLALSTEARLRYIAYDNGQLKMDNDYPSTTSTSQLARYLSKPKYLLASCLCGCNA